MRIEMLGSFGVLDDADRLLSLRRMTTLILAAIAAAGSRGVLREILAERFWPGRSDGQSKSCLRQALTALRKVLAEGKGITLVSDSETVRLEVLPGRIDLLTFEDICERLFTKGAADEELVLAAELYRGPFMEGASFGTIDEYPFIAHREALQEKALRLVEEMSRRPALVGATTGLASRLLKTDPTAEEAHRALIRVALCENRVNRAHKQLELCRKALQEELGVEPEPETIMLIEEGRAAAEVPATVADEVTTLALKPAPPTSMPLSGRPSVAVLPFVQHGNSEHNFLVDGIVNELTTALSRMRAFIVMSRQSAYTYKERFVDARVVGKELGVSYIVDGTVQIVSSEMLVFVQLVETTNSEVVWSGRFRDNISDMFDLQEQIAQKIAAGIHPSIRKTEIERVRRAQPEHLDAYGLVMKGYPKFWLHTAESNAEAVILFDLAIAKDPTYGHALALKAWCHAQRTCYLWTNDAEAERRLALDSAHRAEACVGDDATALAALGATYTMVSAEQGRARILLNRCLEIDPCNAWGWMRLGWLHALSNEPREALASFEQSIQLSPMDPFKFNVYFGQALAWSSLNEYDRAIELVYKGIHLGHSVTWVYRMLACYYALAGNKMKMLEAVDEFRRVHPSATLEQIFKSLPPMMVETNLRYLEAMSDSGVGLPNSK
ncbi:TolB-like protein/DNA-binding SARP family transcriptional activator [Undibacterium sp. GrIS 1.2]|uniref:BTAD domain-containing putative transcriptional regulator n=1 Tax=Undibacterium sp. GrIS 1.2 TaxID=3143933 RepID=UPI0033917FF7